MESVVTSVCNSWRDVEFSDLQKTLESVASELTSNHQKNDISRTNLVNQTKEFRKSASEEVRKSAMTIIKYYQTEFDAVQKRCKYSEDAYLLMYKRLIDLPDPSFALAELSSLQKRADRATEFEFETRRLKENNEELKAKVQELKNHERENKRLQKRLDELSTSLESQIQKNNFKLENECQRKLESKEQELAIFKAEAEEKLSSYEAKNMAISKALEMAQSELFRLKTQVNASETGRSSELELLIDDLEKSNSKLAAAEAELARLREDRAHVPSVPVSDINRLQCRVEELEYELSSCSNEKSSLIDQLESLKLSKASNDSVLQNRIQEAEKLLTETKTALDEANMKINHQLDYDEIKRELSLLRSIEFPDDDDGGNTYNNKSSDRPPLEVLLLKKNKVLENQLAEVNTSRERLQIELTHLKSNEVESRQRIEEQSELIKLLESDLYRLQTGFDETRRSSISSDSKSRLEGQLLAEVIGEQKSNQIDQSLLHIVQNQRDRFRTRAEELEQNEVSLRQQLLSLQNEIESVRMDNVKLYEKIRFLHSFGTSPTTQTVRVHSVGNASSQQQQQQQQQHYSPSSSPTYPSHADSNDPTVIKYSQVYEAQLNPFNQFSRYEKQRVYKKLQPYEKLMLHLGRFVSSDRRLRLGVFLYAIFLHLFIFIALYKAAHFEHSALETEANCRLRFAEHMREAHNQGVGNP